MDILQLINARLARLRPPVAPPDKRAGRSKAEVTFADGAPLTIETLMVGLDDLADERARQMEIVATAEEQRDAILDDPDGDDGQVLAIDARVGEARVALERLQRLESDAHEQLAPLQLAAKQRRWDAATAHYAGLMRSVHEAMQAYEVAANIAWSSRAVLFNAVGAPGWEDQVPKLPRYVRATSAGPVVTDSFGFAEEIDLFARTRIAGPANSPTFAARVVAFVHGKLDAEDLAPPTSTWGAAAPSDGPDHPVVIRLARSYTVDDVVLKVGDLVRVTARDAREIVGANRATLHDACAETDGYAARGFQAMPLRTLPLPRSKPAIADQGHAA